MKLIALLAAWTLVTPDLGRALNNVKPEPAAKAGQAKKKAPKAAEKVYWTCPHEGGHFHGPGKCTNTWCGLDLVKVEAHDYWACTKHGGHSDKPGQCGKDGCQEYLELVKAKK